MIDNSKMKIIIENGTKYHPHPQPLKKAHGTAEQIFVRHLNLLYLTHKEVIL